MTAPQMAVWVIERNVDGAIMNQFDSEREAQAFFRLDLYDQSEYRVVERWVPAKPLPFYEGAATRLVNVLRRKRRAEGTRSE